MSMLRACIDGLDARLTERTASARGAAGAPLAAPDSPADARGKGRTRAVLFKTRREAHDNPQRLDHEAGDVFFDYLGLLWIAYRRPTARVVNAAAAAAAVAAMLVSRVRLRHVLAELHAFGVALLAVLVLSVALCLTIPMACYGSLTLTVALYAPLALGVSIRQRQAALAAPLAALVPTSTAVTPTALPTARTLSAASLAPLLLALGAAEGASLGSAYIFALFCGLNGLALLLASALCHLAHAPTAALGIQIVGALLPTLHLHSVSSWLFEVLIPITGRITLPLEPVVALLVGFIATLPSGTVASLLHATSLSLPRDDVNVRWRFCPATAVSRALLLLSGVALVIAATRSPFSPAAPKRLLVQHVAREVDGVPHDAGLWVTAFDPSGLSTARDDWRALGLPAIASRRAHPCDLDLPSTSCYLSFPYFFPLASLLGLPDGANSVYASEIIPFPEGAALPIRPPTLSIPSTRRLSMEATLANSSASGSDPRAAAIHRVHIRVRGPSHMALVLPEERLVGWSVAPGTPPPRRSPLSPSERVVFAFCTSEAPVLSEQGLDGEPRVWELWVDVAGEEPLELAAYGHYLDVSSTPELEALAKWMPEAAALGYWHFFSSMLARRTVPIR